MRLLEDIMKSYPYDYEIIDPMSNEDHLRKRHQFVLRSLSGQLSIVRNMLNYENEKAYYVSTIPIMPNQTTKKKIPDDAIVYKFYVRQNISKNIHAGVWDADVTWQEALKNLIGNLIQQHTRK